MIQVFVVTADAKPPKSKEVHYAPLVPATKRDEDALGLDDFCGQRFERKWKPITLSVSMPRLPRPDFYNFGCGKFVCNAQAFNAANEQLAMCGELLPVKISRERGKFYLYNVTNCIDVLDYKKSKWRPVLPGKKELIKPAFDARKLGELSIFKIAEDFGTRIYCLERDSEGDCPGFKTIVEESGLTGLRFEKIWSGKEVAV